MALIESLYTDMESLYTDIESLYIGYEDVVVGLVWLPYGVLVFRLGEIEVTLGMMLELFMLPILKPIVDILKIRPLNHYYGNMHC